MEQYTLNQIVDHCERCAKCAAKAKALIDEQGSPGLDILYTLAKIYKCLSSSLVREKEND